MGALIIIALSPLMQHLVPAADGDTFDVSSLVILLVAVISAFLSSQLRTGSLTISVAMLLAIGVSLTGSLHAFGSDSPVAALSESAKVFAGLSLFLLLPIASRITLKDQTIKLFYWLLVFSAATHVTVALLQVFGYVDFTYFQRAGGITAGRPSGGYFHPVSLAFFLLFVALFTNLLADRNLIGRFQRVALVVLSIAGVLLTTHRASLAVLLLGLTLYLLLVLFKRSRIRMTYVLLVLTLFLAAGTVFYLVPAGNAPPLLTGLTGFISETTFDPLNEGQFLRGRGMRWARTIEFMREAPLLVKLFGVGHQPMDPHSDYLRLLLVNGWIGLVAIAFSIKLVAFWLWQRLTDSGRLHLMVLISVTAILSITVKPSTYTYYMWLAAAFCILLLQLYPRTAPARRDQTESMTVVTEPRTMSSALK